MKAVVWGVEWRLAMAHRRMFFLNTIVPLALVLPVATGAVAPEHMAGVYVGLFTAFVVFGSAIPLRWDGQRGMTARVMRGGVSASGYLLQRAAASAALDVVQLTPTLAIVAFAARASGLAFVVAYGTLALTAWVGSLIGVVVAAVGRSMIETAVFAALSTLLLSHMSGVFRTPPTGSYGALLEELSPFRALHEALLDMTIGAPVAGLGATVAWAVLLAALVASLGPRLGASVSRLSRNGLEGV